MLIQLCRFSSLFFYVHNQCKLPFSLKRRFLFSIPVFVRWIFFFIYLAAIIYASLTPPVNIPKIISIPNIDKVIHFLMYMGYCLIAAWALDSRVYSSDNNLPLLKHLTWFLLLVLFMAIAWGLLMELFQRYMAIGRHYSLYDMLANIAGACVGTSLYYMLFGRKNRDTVTHVPEKKIQV